MTTRNKKPAKPKKRASVRMDRELLKEVSSRLATANDVYEQAVTRLAENVRDQVLIPFCDKYELDFRKDEDGTYYFSTSPRWSERQRADAAHVLTILNTELHADKYLGNVVRQYAPHLYKDRSDLGDLMDSYLPKTKAEEEAMNSSDDRRARRQLIVYELEELVRAFDSRSPWLAVPEDSDNDRAVSSTLNKAHAFIVAVLGEVRMKGMK